MLFITDRSLFAFPFHFAKRAWQHTRVVLERWRLLGSSKGHEQQPGKKRLPRSAAALVSAVVLLGAMPVGASLYLSANPVLRGFLEDFESNPLVASWIGTGTVTADDATVLPHPIPVFDAANFEPDNAPSPGSYLDLGVGVGAKEPSQETAIDSGRPYCVSLWYARPNTSAIASFYLSQFNNCTPSGNPAAPLTCTEINPGVSRIWFSNNINNGGQFGGDNMGRGGDGNYMGLTGDWHYLAKNVQFHPDATHFGVDLEWDTAGAGPAGDTIPVDNIRVAQGACDNVYELDFSNGAQGYHNFISGSPLVLVDEDFGSGLGPQPPHLYSDGAHTTNLNGDMRSPAFPARGEQEYCLSAWVYWISGPSKPVVQIHQFGAPNGGNPFLGNQAILTPSGSTSVESTGSWGFYSGTLITPAGTQSLRTAIGIVDVGPTGGFALYDDITVREGACLEQNTPDAAGPVPFTQTVRTQHVYRQNFDDHAATASHDFQPLGFSGQSLNVVANPPHDSPETHDAGAFAQHIVNTWGGGDFHAVGNTIDFTIDDVPGNEYCVATWIKWEHGGWPGLAVSQRDGGGGSLDPGGFPTFVLGDDTNFAVGNGQVLADSDPGSAVHDQWVHYAVSFTKNPAAVEGNLVNQAWLERGKDASGNIITSVSVSSVYFDDMMIYEGPCSGDPGGPSDISLIRYRQTFDAHIHDFVATGLSGQPMTTLRAGTASAAYDPGHAAQLISNNYGGGDYYTDVAFPLQANTTYCIGAWIKWQQGGWPGLGLDEYNIGGGFFRTFVLGDDTSFGPGDPARIPYTDGTDWVFYANEITTSATAHSGRLINQSWDGAGKDAAGNRVTGNVLPTVVLWDNIFIHRGSCRTDDTHPSDVQNTTLYLEDWETDPNDYLQTGGRGWLHYTNRIEATCADEGDAADNSACEADQDIYSANQVGQRLENPGTSTSNTVLAFRPTTTDPATEADPPGAEHVGTARSQYSFGPIIPVTPGRNYCIGAFVRWESGHAPRLSVRMLPTLAGRGDGVSVPDDLGYQDIVVLSDPSVSDRRTFWYGGTFTAPDFHTGILTIDGTPQTVGAIRIIVDTVDASGTTGNKPAPLDSSRRSVSYFDDIAVYAGACSGDAAAAIPNAAPPGYRSCAVTDITPVMRAELDFGAPGDLCLATSDCNVFSGLCSAGANCTGNGVCVCTGGGIGGNYANGCACSPGHTGTPGFCVNVDECAATHGCVASTGSSCSDQSGTYTCGCGAGDISNSQKDAFDDLRNMKLLQANYHARHGYFADDINNPQLAFQIQSPSTDYQYDLTVTGQGYNTSYSVTATAIGTLYNNDGDGTTGGADAVVWTVTDSTEPTHTGGDDTHDPQSTAGALCVAESLFANATCPGGTVASCSCDAGFEGVPGLCGDTDECALGTDNCDAAATCSNTSGSFNCTCNNPNAEGGIDPAAGGLGCPCKYGYTGPSCLPRNECLLQVENSCIPATGANCQNLAVGYECNCHSSLLITQQQQMLPDLFDVKARLATYRATQLTYPTTLTDPLLGFTPQATDFTYAITLGVDSYTVTATANAPVNTDGDGTTGGADAVIWTVTDSTVPAYTGGDDTYGFGSAAGVLCVDPAVGYPNSDCANQLASSCTCKAGFEGNPGACTDIDECSNGSNNCHPNATCTNLPSTFSCDCNVGYAGDGVECTPAVLALLTPLGDQWHEDFETTPAEPSWVAPTYTADTAFPHPIPLLAVAAAPDLSSIVSPSPTTSNDVLGVDVKHPSNETAIAGGSTYCVSMWYGRPQVSAVGDIYVSQYNNCTRDYGNTTVPVDCSGSDSLARFHIASTANIDTLSQYDEWHYLSQTIAFDSAATHFSVELEWDGGGSSTPLPVDDLRVTQGACRAVYKEGFDQGYAGWHNFASPGQEGALVSSTGVGDGFAPKPPHLSISTEAGSPIGDHTSPPFAVQEGVPYCVGASMRWEGDNVLGWDGSNGVGQRFTVEAGPPLGVPPAVGDPYDPGPYAVHLRQPGPGPIGSLGPHLGWESPVFSRTPGPHCIAAFVYYQAGEAPRAFIHEYDANGNRVATDSLFEISLGPDNQIIPPTPLSDWVYVFESHITTNTDFRIEIIQPDYGSPTTTSVYWDLIEVGTGTCLGSTSFYQENWDSLPANPPGAVVNLARPVLTVSQTAANGTPLHNEEILGGKQVWATHAGRWRHYRRTVIPFPGAKFFSLTAGSLESNAATDYTILFDDFTVTQGACPEDSAITGLTAVSPIDAPADNAYIYRQTWDTQPDDVEFHSGTNTAVPVAGAPLATSAHDPGAQVLSFTANTSGLEVVTPELIYEPSTTYCIGTYVSWVQGGWPQFGLLENDSTVTLAAGLDTLFPAGTSGHIPHIDGTDWVYYAAEVTTGPTTDRARVFLSSSNVAGKNSVGDRLDIDVTPTILYMDDLIVHRGRCQTPHAKHPADTTHALYLEDWEVEQASYLRSGGRGWYHYTDRIELSCGDEADAADNSVCEPDRDPFSANQVAQEIAFPNLGRNNTVLALRPTVNDPLTEGDPPGFEQLGTGRSQYSFGPIVPVTPGHAYCIGAFVRWESGWAPRISVRMMPAAFGRAGTTPGQQPVDLGYQEVLTVNDNSISSTSTYWYGGTFVAPDRVNALRTVDGNLQNVGAVRLVLDTTDLGAGNKPAPADASRRAVAFFDDVAIYEGACSGDAALPAPTAVPPGYVGCNVGDVTPVMRSDTDLGGPSACLSSLNCTDYAALCSADATCVANTCTCSDPNAEGGLSAVAGGLGCACKTGYTGDPCLPVDECADTNGCIAATGSSCTDATPGYNCGCAAGELSTHQLDVFNDLRQAKSLLATYLVLNGRLPDTLGDAGFTATANYTFDLQVVDFFAGTYTVQATANSALDTDGDTVVGGADAVVWTVTESTEPAHASGDDTQGLASPAGVLCVPESNYADSNCSGTVASCVCTPGYEGNPGGCVNTDECAQGTHNCDVEGICTDTIGSFTCACKPGFTGAGTVGTCVDTDECAAGSDNCHANASCTNTPGWFSCTCDAGYVGNGVDCVPAFLAAAVEARAGFHEDFESTPAEASWGGAPLVTDAALPHPIPVFSGGVSQVAPSPQKLLAVSSTAVKTPSGETAIESGQPYCASFWYALPNTTGQARVLLDQFSDCRPNGDPANPLDCDAGGTYTPIELANNTGSLASPGTDGLSNGGIPLFLERRDDWHYASRTVLFGQGVTHFGVSIQWTPQASEVFAVDDVRVTEGACTAVFTERFDTGDNWQTTDAVISSSARRISTGDALSSGFGPQPPHLLVDRPSLGPDGHQLGPVVRAHESEHYCVSGWVHWDGYDANDWAPSGTSGTPLVVTAAPPDTAGVMHDAGLLSQLVDLTSPNEEFSGPFVNVNPNTQYCLSALVKWDAGGWPMLGMQPESALEQLGTVTWITDDFVNGPVDPNDFSWQRIEGNFVTAGDTVKLRVWNAAHDNARRNFTGSVWEYQAGAPTGPTQVYWDDIHVYAGPCTGTPLASVYAEDWETNTPLAEQETPIVKLLSYTDALGTVAPESATVLDSVGLSSQVTNGLFIENWSHFSRTVKLNSGRRSMRLSVGLSNGGNGRGQAYFDDLAIHEGSCGETNALNGSVGLDPVHGPIHAQHVYRQDFDGVTQVRTNSFTASTSGPATIKRDPPSSPSLSPTHAQHIIANAGSAEYASEDFTLLPNTNYCLAANVKWEYGGIPEFGAVEYDGLSVVGSSIQAINSLTDDAWNLHSFSMLTGASTNRGRFLTRTSNTFGRNVSLATESGDVTPVSSYFTDIVLYEGSCLPAGQQPPPASVVFEEDWIVGGPIPAHDWQRAGASGALTSVVDASGTVSAAHDPGPQALHVTNTHGASTDHRSNLVPLKPQTTYCAGGWVKWQQGGWPALSVVAQDAARATVTTHAVLGDDVTFAAGSPGLIAHSDGTDWVRYANTFTTDAGVTQGFLTALSEDARGKDGTGARQEGSVSPTSVYWDDIFLYRGKCLSADVLPQNLQEFVLYQEDWEDAPSSYLTSGGRGWIHYSDRFESSCGDEGDAADNSRCETDADGFSANRVGAAYTYGGDALNRVLAFRPTVNVPQTEPDPPGTEGSGTGRAQYSFGPIIPVEPGKSYCVGAFVRWQSGWAPRISVRMLPTMSARGDGAAGLVPDDLGYQEIVQLSDNTVDERRTHWYGGTFTAGDQINGLALYNGTEQDVGAIRIVLDAVDAGAGNKAAPLDTNRRAVAYFDDVAVYQGACVDDAALAQPNQVPPGYRGCAAGDLTPVMRDDVDVGAGASCVSAFSCVQFPGMCDSTASCVAGACQCPDADAVGGLSTGAGGAGCVCAPGTTGTPGACVPVDECGGTNACGAAGSGADCSDTANAYSCICDGTELATSQQVVMDDLLAAKAALEIYFAQRGYYPAAITDPNLGFSPTATNFDFVLASDVGYGGGYTLTATATGALNTDGDGTTGGADAVVWTLTDQADPVLTGGDDTHGLASPAGALCVPETNYADSTCSGTVASCACNPGFEGTPSACTNIDECVQGGHNCDVNGICTDTVGSFSCACKPGYTGAGTVGTCVDVDECAAGTDSCHTNASCSNTAGWYTCTCDAGYVGSGFDCVPAALTSAGPILAGFHEDFESNPAEPSWGGAPVVADAATPHPIPAFSGGVSQVSPSPNTLLQVVTTAGKAASGETAVAAGQPYCVSLWYAQPNTSAQAQLQLNQYNNCVPQNDPAQPLDCSGSDTFAPIAFANNTGTLASPGSDGQGFGGVPLFLDRHSDWFYAARTVLFASGATHFGVGINWAPQASETLAVDNIRVTEGACNAVFAADFESAVGWQDNQGLSTRLSLGDMLGSGFGTAPNPPHILVDAPSVSADGHVLGPVVPALESEHYCVSGWVHWDDHNTHDWNPAGESGAPLRVVTAPPDTEGFIHDVGERAQLVDRATLSGEFSSGRDQQLPATFALSPSTQYCVSGLAKWESGGWPMLGLQELDNAGTAGTTDWVTQIFVDGTVDPNDFSWQRVHGTVFTSPTAASGRIWTRAQADARRAFQGGTWVYEAGAPTDPTRLYWDDLIVYNGPCVGLTAQPAPGDVIYRQDWEIDSTVGRPLVKLLTYADAAGLGAPESATILGGVGDDPRFAKASFLEKWTYFSHSVKVNPSRRAMRLSLGVAGAGTPVGQAYYDDLAIHEGTCAETNLATLGQGVEPIHDPIAAQDVYKQDFDGVTAVFGHKFDNVSGIGNPLVVKREPPFSGAYRPRYAHRVTTTTGGGEFGSLAFALQPSTTYCLSSKIKWEYGGWPGIAIVQRESNGAFITGLFYLGDDLAFPAGHDGQIPYTDGPGWKHYDAQFTTTAVTGIGFVLTQAYFSLGKDALGNRIVGNVLPTSVYFNDILVYEGTCLPEGQDPAPALIAFEEDWEEGAPIAAHDWQDGSLSGTATSVVNATSTASAAHDPGPHALHVTNLASGGDHRGPRLPLEPNTTYCAGAWVKWEQGGWPGLGVGIYDAAGDFSAIQWVLGDDVAFPGANPGQIPVADGTDWVFYSNEWVTGTDVSGGYLTVQSSDSLGKDAGGARQTGAVSPVSVFWDDVFLHRGKCRSDDTLPRDLQNVAIYQEDWEIDPSSYLTTGGRGWIHYTNRLESSCEDEGDAADNSRCEVDADLFSANRVGATLEIGPTGTNRVLAFRPTTNDPQTEPDPPAPELVLTGRSQFAFGPIVPVTPGKSYCIGAFVRWESGWAPRISVRMLPTMSGRGDGAIGLVPNDLGYQDIVQLSDNTVDPQRTHWYGGTFTAGDHLNQLVKFDGTDQDVGAVRVILDTVDAGAGNKAAPADATRRAVAFFDDISIYEGACSGDAALAQPNQVPPGYRGCSPGDLTPIMRADVDVGAGSDCVSAFNCDEYAPLCDAAATCVSGSCECSDADAVGGLSPAGGGQGCVCAAGTQGTPGSCTGIDECAGTNGCTAPTGGTCADTALAYTCACDGGSELATSQASAFDDLLQAKRKMADYRAEFLIYPTSLGDANLGFSPAATNFIYALSAGPGEGYTITATASGAVVDTDNDTTVGGADAVVWTVTDTTEPTHTAGDDTHGEASPAGQLCVATTNYADSDCGSTVASCTCQSGTEGTPGICTDIDECTLGTDNCDANAGCVNTFGSFYCVCNAGYQGDGVTCTEVPPAQVAFLSPAASLVTVDAGGAAIGTYVVEVQDSLGNLAAAYDDPVTLTVDAPGSFASLAVNGGSPILGATSVQVNAVGGVATFNLVVGTYAPDAADHEVVHFTASVPGVTPLSGNGNTQSLDMDVQGDDYVWVANFLPLPEVDEFGNDVGRSFVNNPIYSNDFYHPWVSTVDRDITDDAIGGVNGYYSTPIHLVYRAGAAHNHVVDVDRNESLGVLQLVTSSPHSLGTTPAVNVVNGIARIGEFAGALRIDAAVDGETAQLNATGFDPTGASVPFVVDTVADRFALFTAPSGSITGNPLTQQPVITGVNSLGVLDLDYSELTTLTLSASSAGTLTKNTRLAREGTAIFVELTYTAAAAPENFVIEVNNLSGFPTLVLPAVTSVPPTVAIATELAVTQQPSPVGLLYDADFHQAQITMTQDIVVEAYDDLGALATAPQEPCVVLTLTGNILPPANQTFLACPSCDDSACPDTHVDNVIAANVVGGTAVFPNVSIFLSYVGANLDPQTDNGGTFRFEARLGTPPDAPPAPPPAPANPDPSAPSINLAVMVPDTTAYNDLDGDGLTDYDETVVFLTNPLNPDTDGDGCLDGQERAYWFSSTGYFPIGGLNPHLPDAFRNATFALNAADADFDGFRDCKEELCLLEDKLNPDADDNGIRDCVEEDDWYNVHLQDPPLPPFSHPKEPWIPGGGGGGPCHEYPMGTEPTPASPECGCHVDIDDDPFTEDDRFWIKLNYQTPGFCLPKTGTLVNPTIGDADSFVLPDGTVSQVGAVNLNDADGGSVPATVLVTGSGPPPDESGFVVVGGVYYEVVPDNLPYVGAPVELCVTYDDLDLSTGEETALDFVHFDLGAGTNDSILLEGFPDTDLNVICGLATAFSPFAILKPVDNCPNSDFKLEPGECGCDVIDADVDSDGIADCRDACLDFDRDGYGVDSSPGCIDAGDCVGACIALDCNDFDENINPVASDICDGIDNNCDGTIDDLGNALCDDGTFCNGAEICDGTNGCIAGTPPVIDDGVGCTVDSCDEVGDVVLNVPNHGVCDNGLFCDGSEICDPALDCQAGTAPSTDDGVGCTDDSCDEANDIIVNTANDANCDNGLFCDGAETCDATLDCQAGTAPSTDDGVGCTDDSCDEANDVIVNTANDANCDNGLFCDGAETCDATLDCQAGTAPSTDDGVGCTDDSCDEANDVIVNTANDANCDNGLFCDGAETCDATLDCQAGTAPSTDDGVGCTDDSCDEANDVIVNAVNDANCDNGLFCDGAETCDATLDCQAGTAPSTDDGVGCTDDSCDEANDVIVNTANNANCDNGLFCDGAETCDATLDCQAGTAPSTDDGVGCTDDSCDEANDVIVNTANDANCDNGLFCDGAETCDATLDCQAGTAPSTDDGVGCTDDSCDEANDVIVNTANDANCDNGLFCDGAETCDATLDCQAGTPPVVDDLVGCTDDSCDEANDVIVNTANDANCDNGLFCDGAETCDAALDCQTGTNPCAAGESCDDLGDICVPAGSEVCDDGIDNDGDTYVDCLDGDDCTLPLGVELKRARLRLRGSKPRAEFSVAIDAFGGTMAADYRDGNDAQGLLRMTLDTTPPQVLLEQNVDFSVFAGNPQTPWERWSHWALDNDPSDPSETTGKLVHSRISWQSHVQYLAKHDPVFKAKPLGKLRTKFIHVDETKFLINWREVTLPLDITIDGTTLISVDAAGNVTVAADAELRRRGSKRAYVTVPYRLVPGQVIDWTSANATHSHTIVEDQTVNGGNHFTYFTDDGRLYVTAPLHVNEAQTIKNLPAGQESITVELLIGECSGDANDTTLGEFTFTFGDFGDDDSSSGWRGRRHDHGDDDSSSN